jgi:hypothetical protein
MRKSKLALYLGVVSLLLPVGAATALGAGPAGATPGSKHMTAATFKFGATAVKGKSTCPSTPANTEVVSFSSTKNANTVVFGSCTTTTTTGKLTTTPVTTPGSSSGSLKFPATKMILKTSGTKLTLAANGVTYTVSRTSEVCAVTFNIALPLGAVAGSGMTQYAKTAVASTNHVKVKKTGVATTGASPGFCKAVWKTMNNSTAKVSVSVTFTSGL